MALAPHLRSGFAIAEGDEPLVTGLHGALRRAHAYASATRFVSASCEPEVIELLVGLQQRAAADGGGWFGAWQDAEVAVRAEEYYRAMVRGGRESWNVRDRHMDGTLARLLTADRPRRPSCGPTPMSATLAPPT